MKTKITTDGKSFPRKGQSGKYTHEVDVSKKMREVAKKMPAIEPFKKIQTKSFNPFSLVTHIDGKPIKKNK